jgi:hypothetical protein
VVNMDPAKKLKSLIAKLETKKKRVDPDARKTRKEKVIQHINEVLVQTQVEWIENRVATSGVRPASMYARLGDDEKLREEMKKPGFVLNERDIATGKNVLMEAISSGHYHLVRMLLYEFHAKPNLCSILGNLSPLHMAIDKGYRQIASILITRGADVNAIDSRGCTPMHYVTKISLARLLHRYPVDCCVRSKEKLRPSEHYQKYCAPEEFNVDLAAYLADKEAAQDIRAFRKLTVAGERKEKERELERERRENDSDEEFEKPMSAPAAVENEKQTTARKFVPKYKSFHKPSTAPGMKMLPGGANTKHEYQSACNKPHKMRLDLGSIHVIVLYMLKVNISTQTI